MTVQLKLFAAHAFLDTLSYFLIRLKACDSLYKLRVCMYVGANFPPLLQWLKLRAAFC